MIGIFMRSATRVIENRKTKEWLTKRQAAELSREILGQIIGVTKTPAECIKIEEDLLKNWLEKWAKDFDFQFYGSNDYTWTLIECWRGWTSKNVVETIDFINQLVYA